MVTGGDSAIKYLINFINNLHICWRIKRINRYIYIYYICVPIRYAAIGVVLHGKAKWHANKKIMCYHPRALNICACLRVYTIYMYELEKSFRSEINNLLFSLLCGGVEMR